MTDSPSIGVTNARPHPDGFWLVDVTRNTATFIAHNRDNAWVVGSTGDRLLQEHADRCDRLVSQTQLLDVINGDADA